jgi:hypothetical protein
MAVNYNRKRVLEAKGEFCVGNHETLEQIRDYVDNLIRLHGKDCKLRYCDDWSDRPSDEIYLERDETDDEMARRIAHEEKFEKVWEQANEILEAERREYERLKAKFG